MNPGGATSTFAVLRQFVRKNRTAERCELCGSDLAPDHRHLIEPRARKLVCACGACSILFTSQGAAKYKRVPQRIRFLREFQLTDSQWNSLLIPINVAFFFTSSLQERVVALYPSPAGAPESQLPLDTWSQLIEENPVLRDMETDVEALLVNRLGPSRGYLSAEYYVVPIDECYRLVGLIRTHWRGLSGGTEVWDELQQFFAGLKARACLI